MNLDSRVEQALQAINFVERYKELSDKFSLNRTPKDKRLNIITGELIFDVFEDLGYRAKLMGVKNSFILNLLKKMVILLNSILVSLKD